MATYGRSVVGLLCGLFTGRWLLMALGEVDYGLYGLIAGLSSFISFFNGVLASAVGRFYAVSVGAARAARDSEAALEDCRAWFNTALSVHTVVPVALLLVGYPVGRWVIVNFLTIPPDRVGTCLDLFNLVCLSCLVSMMNVPFQAMYTARQEIAELTVYSFATTLLNVVALYVMATTPRDWLIGYGVWVCLVSVVPHVLIMARALARFPECKIRRSLMFDGKRLKRLGSFAGWQMIGLLSGLLRVQGMAILVNKFYGPRANAAMQVGNTVNGQACALSSAMIGAFYPAITNAYGAGDMAVVRKYSFAVCKFGVLLAMVFALPLLLELDGVLALWLRDPPRYASAFAGVYLLVLLVENSTVGQMIAVNASGRIAKYQIYMGIISFSTVPLAFVLVWLGGAPYVAAVAVLLTVAVYSVVRVFMAERIVGLPSGLWLRSVLVPSIALGAFVTAFGAVPRLFMGEGFFRIVVTTAFCELALIPAAWFVTLNEAERAFVSNRARTVFSRS